MKIRVILSIIAVCSGILSPAFARDVQTGEKVSFEAQDGTVIQGLYHRPSSGRKTFILLHGLGSTQEEWQQFVDKLVGAGYGTLTYDARGHGKSTVGPGNTKLSYNNFGTPGPGSEWDKMSEDLGRAIAFLNTIKGTPEKRIGLIGASLGANICLTYAAKHPEISIVMLLSPGLNYAGIATIGSIESLAARAIAICASPQDTFAYQSSILLHQKIQENKKAVFMAGPSGHGVQMLDTKFSGQLLRWMSKY